MIPLCGGDSLKPLQRPLVVTEKHLFRMWLLCAGTTEGEKKSNLVPGG